MYPDRLFIALGEQASAVSHSCANYDRGHRWEAKRICAAIFMLLAHEGKNVPILAQLDLLRELTFVSYSSGVSVGKIPNTSLVWYEFGADVDATAVPACYLPGTIVYRTEMSFDEWWNEVIFMSREGATVSRRELAIAMRHTDGGAHVAPKISESYRVMSVIADAGWTYTDWNDVSHPFPNVHLATMRQIGQEVIESMRISASVFPSGFIGCVI